MRATTFRRFEQIFINHSRQGSLVVGEVSKLEKQIDQFEPITRLFRVARAAEAQPGDLVDGLNEHFILVVHSTEQFHKIFRLISLPDAVEWVAPPVAQKDPLTGKLVVPDDPPTLQQIQAKRIFDRGLTADAAKHEHRRVTYLTGYPIKVGDRLENQQVRSVYTEQGLLFAET